ncbi:MAG TPA: Crp/Fnr family transcriptional regulator [Acetobacteraceae bacterium]|nr:Crp/Fnr family transcriptional regulator [Acetobacteraceae bacterium]
MHDLPRVVLRGGAQIGEKDQPAASCYLVERGLVASYVNVDDDRRTCVGLLGPGDVVGLGTLFGRSGDECARSQAIVPVQLLCIPAQSLRLMLNRSPALLDVCLQQLQASLTEIQHVAACNARHLLPARCAHWLLRLQARVGDVLPVTHEFLASVLGVRRAGITVTLQALQRNGAIRQQRGSVVIIDPEQLRGTACGCPVAIGHPPFVMPASQVAAPAGALGQASGERVSPRALSDSAIRARMTEADSVNPATARIEAVLQVCRAVMERTHEMLV